MLKTIDIARVLFLDVECVSEYATYDELTDEFKYLWKLKCKSILKKYDEEITDEEAAETYIEKAGIFAEFGKIVCISVGFISRDKDKSLKIRLKSYADDDEKLLLQNFCELLNQYYKPHSHFICGHNIKEFDIPYICRRLLINQIQYPSILEVQGKKPWETKQFIDTLVLWKYGDFKNYTSLKLLAAVLGFPSPKDDIDGSEVGRVYWQEQDLERIAVYCEKDVLATAQLFLKFKFMPILTAEQVIHVD